jgi:adenylate kinase family enzyme
MTTNDKRVLMKNIVIIGTAGSGKTTLARNLAHRLGQKNVDLDNLYWLPNWGERSPEDFKERVSETLGNDSWIIAGDYGVVRDQIWDRADTIIWLNYSFPVVFGRAIKRTFIRAITKEEILNGNKETLRKNFFSKDSMLLWVLQTYWKRRKDYPKILKKLETTKKILIFKKPSEARRWLDRVSF